jgi:hypothetical protein
MTFFLFRGCWRGFASAEKLTAEIAARSAVPRKAGGQYFQDHNFQVHGGCYSPKILFREKFQMAKKAVSSKAASRAVEM